MLSLCVAAAVLLVPLATARPLRFGAEPCSAALVDGYVPPVTAFTIEPRVEGKPRPAPTVLPFRRSPLPQSVLHTSG
jgi:hypothetical protein